MRVEDQALQNQMSEIDTEIKAIFDANMKFVGWSVPESDEKYTKEHIIALMRAAIDEIEAREE